MFYELHDRALNHQGLIKLYEEDRVRYADLPGAKKLWLNGPLISTDKRAEAGSVALSAASPVWRFVEPADRKVEGRIHSGNGGVAL